MVIILVLLAFLLAGCASNAAQYTAINGDNSKRDAAWQACSDQVAKSYPSLPRDVGQPGGIPNPGAFGPYLFTPQPGISSQYGYTSNRDADRQAAADKCMADQGYQRIDVTKPAGTGAS